MDKGREAVSILIDSFEDDPFFRWVNSNVFERRQLLRKLFSMAVAAANSNGFLEANDMGVLIYEPPDSTLFTRELSEEWERVIRAAFQGPVEFFDRYNATIGSTLPSMAPFWYLKYLAVPKRIRRQGIGFALLSKFLNKVDSGSECLILHTANPLNLRFYGRFGFLIRNRLICEGGGPTVYTLERR
jgi:GNAT superfamily N-acetyltransferase